MESARGTEMLIYFFPFQAQYITFDVTSKNITPWTFTANRTLFGYDFIDLCWTTKLKEKI